MNGERDDEPYAAPAYRPPERLVLLEDPEPLIGELAAEGFRIARVAPALGDKQRLIRELRLALGLPDYMGPNFDALYECLTDPSVMGDTPRLLVVLQASGTLQLRDREAFHAFLELYDQAGRFWQDRGGDLRLCLVT